VTTQILEIPEVRQRVSPLTVEEYHRLDEFNENGKRTELIRGIVIEKMSKSPPHRFITSVLYDRFLAGLPAGFTVSKEEPLTFLDSEPEPDISVTRGTRQDFAKSHPTSAELVIEVAVSSPLDRANAALYAEAGIKEYWIVRVPQRQVEVYRRPLNGQYQERFVRGSQEILECAALPTIRLHVGDLFAKQLLKVLVLV
jgi:Uma2 family endonuclease